LGRFIQADTLVPGAGNPQALNRYAYAANNPVQFIDPNGHMTSYSWTGNEYNTLQFPPPPYFEIHLSLRDIVDSAFSGPSESYEALATAGDGLQVAVDSYCVGVSWIWAIKGGIAGSPGEFAVPVTGAAGWVWGELTIQPAMKFNDILGVSTSIMSTIGDIKAGRTNVAVEIRLTPQGIIIESSVQIAHSTVNDWLLTTAGLLPFADIAEISLAIDAESFLQDIGIFNSWPLHQNIHIEQHLHIHLPNERKENRTWQYHPANGRYLSL
jgi:hypothetical protein